MSSRTAIVSWLVGATALLTAQGVGLAASGGLRLLAVEVVWTLAGTVAFAGTLLAALRVPGGRVGLAWSLWACGTGSWLVGALVRDGLALAGDVSVPSAADAFWLLFALFGLAGLAYRSPRGSFSFRLFLLDALPVVLLATAATWSAGGYLRGGRPGDLLFSSLYLVPYALLALVSFQLMAVEGIRRVPANMWILGPGFCLAAAGALVWSAEALGRGAAQGRWPDLLWTAGLLVVGASGFRRALGPNSFTRLFRPERESGIRALPPAGAVLGLVAVSFVAPERYDAVVHAFMFAAVVLVAARFYLVRNELLRSREALAESEERYRGLFENARDMVLTVDARGVFTAINNAVEEITGYAREELLGRSYDTLAAPEDLGVAHREFERKITGEAEATSYEIEIVRKDGSRATLEVASRRVEAHGGEVRVEGIARDVTERRQAEESLRASEERYRELFENANDIVVTLDLEGRFTSINRAGERSTAYTREELLGKNLADLAAPEHLESARAQLRRRLAGEASATTHELEVVAKDRRRVPLELSTRLISEQGRPVGVQVIARDIAERKRLEEELRHQAFHDSLTGLANRALFGDRVEHALARGRRHSASVAVLFVDLDDFKTVNDSLGHEAGDQLLVAVGERLRTSLRPADTCARLGGDEFAVLLEDPPGARSAVRIAERILEALEAPFSLQGRDVFVRASVGIAFGISNGEAASELLRNADIAMYRAKTRGKGRYVVFEPSMLAPARERLELTTELQQALEGGQFTLYYQPILVLASGAVAGVEGLLRWRHPKRGLVHPGEFIALAEETRLILPLSRWALGEACRQASSWQARYPCDPPLTMSVNVSGRHLQESGFVADVVGALADSGLAPESLILEITESVLVHDLEGAQKLQELKEAGVQLAVDDFGAGYSSLNYLRRFPIDILKIDKSFVQAIGGEARELHFADTIVRFGKTLGLQVIAEGIERAEQRDQLRRLGCRLGQGFLFAPPLDEQGMGALLAENAVKARRSELRVVGRRRASG